MANSCDVESRRKIALKKDAEVREPTPPGELS